MQNVIDGVYPIRQWYHLNQPIKLLVLNGIMRRLSQEATPKNTQYVKIEPCQLAYRLFPSGLKSMNMDPIVPHTRSSRK